MNESVKRHWWCRNGMVDDESLDGILRLKTVPPEPFVPAHVYDRDIKALKDCCDEREHTLAGMQATIEAQVAGIKTLKDGLEFQVERTCDAGELTDTLREERDAALASLAAADEEITEQVREITKLRELVVDINWYKQFLPKNEATQVLMSKIDKIVSEEAAKDEDFETMTGGAIPGWF